MTLLYCMPQAYKIAFIYAMTKNIGYKKNVGNHVPFCFEK